MKLIKGEPGYITKRKHRYLLLALAEFAVVIALLVTGYVIYRTRLNVFTIVAVLGCLPAAKMLVEFIVMAPHHGTTPAVAAEVENEAGLLTRVYDLLLTDREKIMPVDVMVISGATICGYTSSDKTDEERVSGHIKQTLQAQGREHITVKVFHNYKAFLTRASGLNSMRKVDKQVQTQQEAEIKQLILSLSM